MIPFIADSSVLIKWFLPEGETEVEAAEALRRAHIAELVHVHILELTTYELGNTFVRKLPAGEAADRLDDLLMLCGPPYVLASEWRRDAADVAHTHQLTFYDAAFAAAARGLGVSLVSADRKLLAAGLAESVTGLIERLRL